MILYKFFLSCHEKEVPLPSAPEEEKKIVLCMGLWESKLFFIAIIFLSVRENMDTSSALDIFTHDLVLLGTASVS